MNLRCIFHVSVSPETPQKPQLREARPQMPTLLDLDIEWVDDPKPRGMGYETWQRARGWSSED